MIRCLVPVFVAFFAVTLAENVSCEASAFLQHGHIGHAHSLLNEDREDCSTVKKEEKELCKFRNMVKTSPIGLSVDQRWQATGMKGGEARTPEGARSHRVTAISSAMTMYVASLENVILEKKLELEKVRKEKAKAVPWATFMLELAFGAIFVPAVGRFKASTLVSGLDGKAAQESMKQLSGVVEKTVTKLGMKGYDALREKVTEQWRQLPVNQFLDKLVDQQKKFTHEAIANMGSLTEAQMYAMYLTYTTASTEDLRRAVDSAHATWEEQVNGLGWRVKEKKLIQKHRFTPRTQMSGRASSKWIWIWMAMLSSSYEANLGRH